MDNMYFNLMQWNYNTSTFKVKRLDCMSESSNVIVVCRKFGLLTRQPLSLQQLEGKIFCKCVILCSPVFFVRSYTMTSYSLHLYFTHLSGTHVY